MGAPLRGTTPRNRLQRCLRAPSVARVAPFCVLCFGFWVEQAFAASCLSRRICVKCATHGGKRNTHAVVAPRRGAPPIATARARLTQTRLLPSPQCLEMKTYRRTNTTEQNRLKTYRRTNTTEQIQLKLYRRTNTTEQNQLKTYRRTNTTEQNRLKIYRRTNTTEQNQLETYRRTNTTEQIKTRIYRCRPTTK